MSAGARSRETLAGLRWDEVEMPRKMRRPRRDPAGKVSARAAREGRRAPRAATVRPRAMSSLDREGDARALAHVWMPLRCKLVSGAAAGV